MRLHRILAGSCSAALLSLSALPAAAGASHISAPVIHEKFTVLACPSRPATTTQIEGCAEHRVIALDRRIDALNAKIFARLGRTGRGTFIRANDGWVSYRNAICASEASIYSGATIQPVASANCLVAIDGSHTGELKKMLVALSPAG